MLSRIFALQPAVRQSTTRLYSSASSSTHFLNDFMTSKEKGPVQLAIESKVIMTTFKSCRNAEIERNFRSQTL